MLELPRKLRIRLNVKWKRFSVFEALSFSVLVVAGAAQLTALELMQDNTPCMYFERRFC